VIGGYTARKEGKEKYKAQTQGTSRSTPMGAGHEKKNPSKGKAKRYKDATINSIAKGG